MKRFQNMAKMFLNLIGEQGQQNFKEFLWARRHFDDSVSQIRGTIEASGSKEDCLRALQHLLDVCPCYSPTKDDQDPLAAPASGELNTQAFKTVRKSKMVQAEAKRHEFLATMVFAERWDRYTQKLNDQSPISPEHEWLKQYSEPRGRYLGQGVGYRTLLILCLVDHSDPNSASFTPPMVEAAKKQLENARRDGRWFSKLYRHFGAGISCYITTQTKIA
jgi:hypothetical protein